MSLKRSYDIEHKANILLIYSLNCRWICKREMVAVSTEVRRFCQFTHIVKLKNNKRVEGAGLIEISAKKKKSNPSVLVNFEFNQIGLLLILRTNYYEIIILKSMFLKEVLHLPISNIRNLSTIKIHRQFGTTDACLMFSLTPTITLGLFNQMLHGHAI